APPLNGPPGRSLERPAVIPFPYSWLRAFLRQADHKLVCFLGEFCFKPPHKLASIPSKLCRSRGSGRITGKDRFPTDPMQQSVLLKSPGLLRGSRTRVSPGSPHHRDDSFPDGVGWFFSSFDQDRELVRYEPDNTFLG